MRDDCISRQAAIDAADKVIERDTSGNNDVVKAMIAWSAYIKGLPPVKPEQKVGHWTREEHPDAMPTLTTTWCCSVCGKDQGYGEPPFCPNCGAPMERQA